MQLGENDQVTELSFAAVQAAAVRIAGQVRPVGVARADDLPVVGGSAELYWALEHLQHTGSFKARGARSFLLAHRETGTLPAAGVAIASGGNAGMACAWAARELGVAATVFLPVTAPAVKVERLRSYGADVRLEGSEYAGALAACSRYVTESGALASHAYDHPDIAAGAGTLFLELHSQIPGLTTVVVAVGGGGLLAGVATAASHAGIRTIGVEPRNCRAFNAGLTAGNPVEVPVDSVAADSLGARKVTPLALDAARQGDVRSMLVSDEEIVHARQLLWDDYRLAVEHAAGTALAGVLSPTGYQPAAGEKVCVVLCGANTNPSDLI